MADLATIGISVGATLVIQNVYYVVIQFPHQLHTNKVRWAEASLRHYSAHATSQMINREIGLTCKVLRAWVKQVNSLEEQEMSTFSDRTSFISLLSELLMLSARLEGLVQKSEQSGYMDVIKDLLEEIKIVTQISVDLLSDDHSLSKGCLSRLVEIDYINSRAHARLEHKSIRDLIEEGTSRYELITLSADVKNTMRRFHAAGYLLVILTIATSLWAYTSLLAHLRWNLPHQFTFIVLLACATGLVPSAIFGYCINAAHKDADVQFLNQIISKIEEVGRGKSAAK